MPDVPKEIAAEELFEEFKEHSVAEFFKKNKQMLGLSGKIRSITTIVHELVTNSLDAAEAARILPDLEVSIRQLGEEHYEIEAIDNGPGIPKKNVAQALGQLLAGTKFHRLVQQRGQQGIGVSGVILYSQMTSGKPIYVASGTNKESFELTISIDAKKNAPKIHSINELQKKFRGIRFKAEFKDVLYRKGEASPLEYLRRTALANPHVQIIFNSPDPAEGKIVFERASKVIPKLPLEVKPHPRGTSVDELLGMAKHTIARKTSTFLKTDLDRFGDNALKDLKKMITFDLEKDPKQLKWEEAEQVVKAFKVIQFIAPRTDVLRPITEERLEKSLKNIIEPEFFSVITRKPAVYRGYPFQVEVAVAFGGNAGRETAGVDEATGKQVRQTEIMRFANLTPLLFEGGACCITKAVKAVEWKRYGIKEFDNAPLTVLVNLISVHIPYTGAGKTAIADEDEIFEEMRLALMDAGRKIGRFISGKRNEKEKHEKKKLFLKYASEVAIGLNKLTGKPKDVIEKKLHAIVLKKLKLEEEELENGGIEQLKGKKEDLSEEAEGGEE